MLRSVRELEQFRVRSADGRHSGRIRDVYFDDSAWKVTHLVLSIEPSAFGRKEVLLSPADVAELSDESEVLHLRISAEELDQLPPASSALPVCKQYESFVYASRRATMLPMQTDPHLRSAKAVIRFQLDIAGECGGNLADFLYDSESWQIRYLGIEQKFDRKAMKFFVLPQDVERITWASQRVILRELNPVAIELAQNEKSIPSKVAA